MSAPVGVGVLVPPMAAVLGVPAGHTSLPPAPLCTPSFSPKQARKSQVVAGKKEAVKVAPHKTQRAHTALGVAKNNEINLKK